MRLLTAAFAILGLAGPAESDTIVRLVDPAGFAVEGEVQSYDGEFYRIETDLGVLTLGGGGLTCEGSACPPEPKIVLDIAAPDSGMRRLFVTVLREFARKTDAQIAESYGADGLEVISLIDPVLKGSAEFRLVPAGGDWEILRGPATPAGRGRTDTAIGFDALVPAVGAGNPVTEMTLVALRAAVAGEFPDWTGLGGDDLAVEVIWPSELDPQNAVRLGLRPGAGASRFDLYAKAAAVAGRTPGALAILPLSDIGNAVPLVVTGVCGRGSLGVGDAIRTGDYPFSDVLVLRHPTRRGAPILRRFVDWAGGPEAWQAVRRAGFLALSVGRVAAVRDGRQEAEAEALSLGGTPVPRAAVDALEGAQRVNVAMRFQDGSSLPDRTAPVQIGRLIDAVKSGEFEGRKLIFVGFSDADGSVATNLRLSERRAETIRNEVVAALGGSGGVTAFDAIGIGEAMPVACNGVDWGERLNRRVEVWVADP